MNEENEDRWGGLKDLLAQFATILIIVLAFAIFSVALGLIGSFLQ